MERDSRKLIKRLKKEGWEHDRTEGSHHIFKHPQKNGIIVVPHPKKDIIIGTLQAIYRAANWDKN